MRNHISCATLKNQIHSFVLHGWWYWFLFLSRSRGLVSTADVSLSALKSARRQASCPHAWLMLFMKVQVQCLTAVLMLIPQGLQSLPGHGSQCWYHAKSADALSDVFGADHPSCMLLARIPVLRVTVTDEGVCRLTAQMNLLLYRITI